MYGAPVRGFWGGCEAARRRNEILKETLGELFGDRQITTVSLFRVSRDLVWVCAAACFPISIMNKVNLVPDEDRTKVCFGALGNGALGDKLVPPPTEPS